MVKCRHESCGAAEKELENIDFDDAYSMMGSEQEKVFSSVAQKYCKASRA